MAEAVVTLPDGRRVRVTGSTRAEILSQARALSQPGDIIPNAPSRPLPAEQRLFTQPTLPGVRMSTVGAPADTSAFDAGLRAAGSKAIENVLGVPDVLANFGLRAITGGPTFGEPQKRLEQAIRARLGFAPARDLEAIPNVTIPRPSGSQIVAGAETAAQLPGAILDDQPLNIAQRFQEQQAQDLEAAQAHPVATALGGVAADAATIAGGRIPARGFFRSAFPKVRPPRVTRTPRPGFKAALDASATKLANTLGKGALKAGEAGLEGATLALLDKGDPLQTAAFAAGAQAAGSLILAGTERFRKRPLSSTFWALLLGHQLFKAIGPGERNLFESSDQAINEIIAGYGLGVLARVAGMKRIPRTGFAANFPEAVTDSITAIPRGMLTSLWEDLAKDENKNLQPVLERYAAGGFNDNQRARIERAFKSGKLASEVEKMMKIPSFREELDGENE